MTQRPDNPADAPTQGSRFARAHHILLYFLGATLLIWIFSGFYKVSAGEIAIVERLGQYQPWIDGRTDPGLHFHLPWPIDRVSLISVQQQYTLQVDTFGKPSAELSEFKLSMIRAGSDPKLLDSLFDPYVITADKSVVHLQINVLFTVEDPLAWLQSVSHEYSQDYDPKVEGDMRNELFQQIAQRAIVDKVGRITLTSLLQEGRGQLPRDVQKAFQDAIDNPNPAAQPGDAPMKLGVRIVSVTLSMLEVPDMVKPAYANLVDQLQKRTTNITNAQSDAQGRTIAADGEKSTLIATAESYRQTTEQGATGEMSRFSAALQQYEKAPDVTRINLAVDAARTVFAGASRIVFAQPGQSTRLVVDPPQYIAPQTQPGQ